MKVSVAVFLLGAMCAAPVLGQGPGQGQAPPPPATDTVAPEIPGVVKAGTKVVVIKDDFQGTEGPTALPEGTLAFTEGGANRITRIDRDGKVSAYLENSNGSNALAFDSKGRMVSVQRGPSHVQIGVIGPKGAEATLADDYAIDNVLLGAGIFAGLVRVGEGLGLAAISALADVAALERAHILGWLSLALAIAAGSG